MKLFTIEKLADVGPRCEVFMDREDAQLEAKLNHNAPRIHLPLGDGALYFCKCGSSIFIAKPDCFRCVECWRGHQGGVRAVTLPAGGAA